MLGFYLKKAQETSNEEMQRHWVSKLKKLMNQTPDWNSEILKLHKL